MVCFITEPRDSMTCLKDYFGNFPMRNDRTWFRRNSFSSPRHRWPFMKSHYNQTILCAVCVWWGNNPALQKLLFYHPAYPMVIVFEHILRLVVLTFCPQGGVTSRQTHWLGLRIIIQASASRFPYPLFGLVVPRSLWLLSCALFWLSQDQSSVSASIFFYTVDQYVVLLLLQTQRLF